MQPFAEFGYVFVFRTVVNSQIEVELCASAAVQNRALADSVCKSDFVVNTRSFASEVRDQEFRRPDLVKDLLCNLI